MHAYTTTAVSGPREPVTDNGYQRKPPRGVRGDAPPHGRHPPRVTDPPHGAADTLHPAGRYCGCYSISSGDFPPLLAGVPGPMLAYAPAVLCCDHRFAAQRRRSGRKATPQRELTGQGGGTNAAAIWHAWQCLWHHIRTTHTTAVPTTLPTRRCCTCGHCGTICHLFRKQRRNHVAPNGSRPPPPRRRCPLRPPLTGCGTTTALQACAAAHSTEHGARSTVGTCRGGRR